MIKMILYDLKQKKHNKLLLRTLKAIIGTRITQIGRIHTDLIARFRPLNEKPVSQYGKKSAKIRCIRVIRVTIVVIRARNIS